MLKLILNMTHKTLIEVIEGINLKGDRVDKKLLEPLPTTPLACDCGACDDGGYCICDDSTIIRPEYKNYTKAA